MSPYLPLVHIIIIIFFFLTGIISCSLVVFVHCCCCCCCFVVVTGVGKSSVCMGLSTALASMGHKVRVVTNYFKHLSLPLAMQ